jgi:hypothetical protein
VPKRERDYAKERARRDAKYKALGYKGYNQYDKERRQRLRKDSQYSKEWHKLREQQIRSKPKVDPQELVDKLLKHFEEAGNDMSFFDQYGDYDESAYWAAFRVAYNNLAH